MTATVNGHRPDVTVGGDVRMRVRASENPTEAASGPDSTDSSAYTRAISQDAGDRPASAGSKVRDFVSLHKGATAAAAGTSWFGREQPASLYDTAGDVFPAKGEAGNWAVWTAMSFAGVLRLTALSLCYLAAFCFDTRIRATVSTLLIAVALTARAVLS